MTVLTKPPTQGDVLKFEPNPNYTRKTVTLLAGTNYPVGAVLGRITRTRAALETMAGPRAKTTPGASAALASTA